MLRRISKPIMKALAAVLIIVGVFVVVFPVFAQSAWYEQAILEIVSTIVFTITNFLGNFLLLLIEILVKFFSFSDFINTPAVQLGWVMIRDLANMAIVIALIIIAFSTVFRIQQYAASKLLFRLVIAAILVNFSLLIAGLIIDVGQVIMMTFVNAFQSLAAGNLVVGFGIEDMLKVATSDIGEKFDQPALPLIGAMLLAVIMLAVAIGVVLVFIVILLQRVIYLWILSIFSPVAWVAPLLPGGASYASQWWTHFGKQVFIGPVLAFGFWLSMSILSGLGANDSLIRLQIENTSNATQQEALAKYFLNEASSSQRVFDFMVTIALLLGTLFMAKSAGGFAGSFAGSMPGRLKKAGSTALRGVRKAGLAGVVGAGALGAVAGPAGVLAGLGLGVGARKLAAAGMRKIPGPVGGAYRDYHEKQQDRKVKAIRTKLEKSRFVDEEMGSLFDKVFLHPVMRPIFGNIGRAGRKISGDIRGARNFLGASQPDIEGTKKSELYSALSGPTKKIMKFFPIVNGAFATRFESAVPGMNKDKVIGWQQAIAAYRKATGENSPELDRMAVKLEASPHSTQSTKNYEASVTYSKTDTGKLDELSRHNRMREGLEAFRQAPENEERLKGMNSEQIENEFFKSELAAQAYKQGNQDTQQLVNTAGKHGATPEDLSGVINTEHLTVNVAGEMEYSGPEPPSPEKMQEEFKANEKELERVKPLSENGVTPGGYARDKGNMLGVGLDKINEELEKLGLGRIIGFDDDDSEGVRVKNTDAVRQGLLSMVGNQLEALNSAKTDEQKVAALKESGIDAKVDENLDKKVISAKERLTTTQDRLSDKQRVDQEGLRIINKNRLAGSARQIARHEEAHELFDKNDPTGIGRQELTSSLPEMIKNVINSHLAGRSDYGSLSDVDKTEEYAADVLAGKVIDEDFRVYLNNSGLLKKPKGAVAAEFGKEEGVVTKEAKDALKKSPKASSAITTLRTQVAQPNQLFTIKQFLLLRKALSGLSQAVLRSGKQTQDGLGVVAGKIINLGNAFPHGENPTLLEFEAAAENGVTKVEIEDIVNKLT